ncbi:hypothetical protein BKA69DRAFT_18048 [Paraphysoderma sedebokerense]|nr:hypothetical protein BKA69DRAFT_18048 [Paraphysoderma sedebokerense]
MVLGNKSVVTAVCALAVFLAVALTDSSSYESLSASQKLKYLWDDKITKNPADFNPSFMNPLKALALTLWFDMNKSFDVVTDEMPKGRSKGIHSSGATGKIEWVPAENKYSGVFQSGGEGIMRMSAAVEPSKEGTVVGLAVKILRNGVSSANTFAMVKLDPQPSYNFFKNSYSNILPEEINGVPLKVLGMKFDTASKFKFHQGLSGMASHDVNGKEAQPISLPFQLVYVPNPELTQRFPDEMPADQPPTHFITQLGTIEPETTLFTVYAVETPYTGARPEGEVVGKIVLKERFVKSQYGDNTLFFRHTRFEKDLELTDNFNKKFTKQIKSNKQSKVEN